MSTTTWSPTVSITLPATIVPISNSWLSPRRASKLAIAIVDDDGVELFVGNVELTEQIAIYHRVPGMFQPLWGITCPRRKPARIVAGLRAGRPRRKRRLWKTTARSPRPGARPT